MEGLYQKYLDNLTRAFELSKPQITAEMSGDQIIDTIRGDAEKLFRIHQENDTILKEILFSRTAEVLTPSEVEQLQALAGALFNFSRSPDMGIAHYIHRILYAYAVYHHDIDLTIRELYYQGITLLYMNLHHSDSGTDMFSIQVGQFFEAGAAYIDQYEALKNPETRSYILRCLGNLKFALPSRGSVTSEDALLADWNKYMAVFGRAMDIFRSPHYREMDPDIPWDHYIYTMHYDRVKYLSSLRNSPCNEIAKAVLESAEYVYRNQAESAKAKEKNVGIRTQYVYGAARYHAGLIPAEELIEILFAICENAAPDDFSGDNIWAMLYCPEYLLYYSYQLPPESQRALRPRLEQVVQRQREFLFRLPKNEYAAQVSQSVQAIASFVPDGDDTFTHRILDYILACHPPTFVHSNMVALLSQRVCQELLRKDPSRLNGAFGFEHASEHQEELLSQIYQAGLYHDLGKCMILNYVGLYTRRLLGEEFDCIKLHTVFGFSLLESLGMEDIANVSRYHHCTYDGTGGYPVHLPSCPQRVRPIVDIITVVDSLDAGTDNVGRSYASAKTYDRIIAELRREKGPRYAPYIVELFDDPDFYAEIEAFIRERRRQVYLDAFLQPQKEEPNIESGQ